MLKVKSLTKSFGQRIIFSHLNMHIKPGEIVGLVGENGAGKSTLLQIIATLQKPTSGKLFLKEIDYHADLKKIRRYISYVPQEISLWEHLSVEENMRFFETLAWKRKTNRELKALCEEMNLTEWQESVATLSGGTKRKLNLAISLIHDLVLLLLDEPTVGIDLKSKQEIAQYLKHLAETKNISILYISHDMDEILHLCDYTIGLGKDPFYESFLREKGQTVLRFDKPLLKNSQ